MSAVHQPQIGGRDVVRCDCGLTQFSTQSASCRRCHAPFVETTPAPRIVSSRAAAPLSASCVGEPITTVLPLVIKILRCANGLSQRELANIMGVPRTYISKMENQRATPTMESLERFATALKISPFAILAMCEGAIKPRRLVQ